MITMTIPPELVWVNNHFVDVIYWLPVFLCLMIAVFKAIIGVLRDVSTLRKHQQGYLFTGWSPGKAVTFNQILSGLVGSFIPGLNIFLVVYSLVGPITKFIEYLGRYTNKPIAEFFIKKVE